MGIRWLCRSSRWIRATGRHHARHAGRFCFWSSATRLRLRSPIGPESLHTQPCGLRLGVCAPFGSHKTGTCLAISEEGAAGRYPGSAALLPSDGWIGGRSSCGLCAKYALPLSVPFPFPSPPNPIPLHCGAHGGAAVSITLPAPVVRIAEKSCDRTLSGTHRCGSSAVAQELWCPHPMARHGEM